MAFAFFRKRQKMVVIIMAVLMVSFLVGIQGFSTLFHPQRSKGLYGTTAAGGEITVAEIAQAKSDIDVLQRIGLGAALGSYGEMGLAFVQTLSNDNPNLTYALLLDEAERSGVSVTKYDIDSFFEMGGYAGEDYANLVGEIRSDAKLPEDALRAVAGRWVRVYKTFRASLADVPPSDRELERLFRDLAEKIDLTVVKLPVGKYLPKDAAPTAQQVEEMFQRYRGVEPGQFPTIDSMGFGYRLPDRVSVSWLLVRQSSVDRAIRPLRRQVENYWYDHKSEFTLPVETQPASQPATASAPAERRMRPMTFAEAEPHILDILKRQEVGARVSDVLSLAERLVRDLSDAAGDRDVYELVRDEMKQSADRVLDRKIRSLAIANERLDRAMELLAEQAGLRVICYPWGEHGGKKLDPSVRVSLTGTDMTLRAALDDITRQVKWPKIEWTLCKGLRDVLFPMGGEAGVDLFPVTVGRTALVSLSEVRKQDLLSDASTDVRGGRGLMDMLQEMVAQGGKSTVLSVGAEGPRMVAGGDEGGRLLWRVTGFSASHEPQAITEEIRKRIDEDLRTQAGFDAARAQAEALRAAAEKKNLTAAAQDLKLEAAATGLFSRRLLAQPRDQLMRLAWQFRRRDLMFRAMMSPPFLVEWNDVPTLSAPNDHVRQALMERVFALAPKDVEKPESAGAPIVVTAPFAREVLVLQRVGYEPAYRNEYVEGGRGMLAGAILEMREYDAQRAWFAFRGVTERVGYVERIPEQGE